MKTYESYVKVIEAIDCYEDLVLAAAREWALELCKNTDMVHGADNLLDELNAHYKDDSAAIGAWDPEEELCTDDERLDAVFGRQDMHDALDVWDTNEDRTTALLHLMRGMLTRSVAYEKMYC